VNELVAAVDCPKGYVAGYFFGADIDPFWGPKFNNGEIFYALVPDPVPTLKSCAHPVTEVKRLVPVTFIHEFQHMISYNHHVLKGGGNGRFSGSTNRCRTTRRSWRSQLPPGGHRDVLHLCGR